MLFCFYYFNGNMACVIIADLQQSIIYWYNRYIRLLFSDIFSTALYVKKRLLRIEISLT